MLSLCGSRPHLQLLPSSAAGAQVRARLQGLLQQPLPCSNSQQLSAASSAQAQSGSRHVFSTSLPACPPMCREHVLLNSCASSKHHSCLSTLGPTDKISLSASSPRLICHTRVGFRHTLSCTVGAPCASPPSQRHLQILVTPTEQSLLICFSFHCFMHKCFFMHKCICTSVLLDTGEG